MTSSAQPLFRVEVVAKDLRVPWAISFAADGRIFFTERPGRVRVIENGRLLPEPMLTLPDVETGLKLGLMGMTLHPDFQENHWLYLAYSYRQEKGERVRIVRYKETNNTLTERVTIIDDIPAASNHAGCRIKFGPDKKLYVTTGDANVPELAQRLDSLAGKTLRLNEDGSPVSDNPFIGQPDVRAEIWSYGHRNSQGLDWQPGTGLLFQSEHGPDGGDEINIVERGQNYGWPEVHHQQQRPGMVSPILEYTPSIAPAGATFYRGSAFPALRGSFLVGCLRGEAMLEVELNGKTVTGQQRHLHKKYGRIREVAEAPDGTIYLSTSQHDPPEGTGRPDFDMIVRLLPEQSRGHAR